MAEALALRDDVEESLTEGELPSQGGSFVPTVLPNHYHLRLPANLDQCWDAKDYEKKDSDGHVIMGPDSKTPLVEQHLLLKFGKENPLIVVGGEFDGLPVSSTITTMARRRGKKGDATAPIVSDMTYFLRDSLNDQATKIVMRKDYIPAINRFAGKIFRIESGLSAQCDPERVRYIDDGNGGVVEDPDGVKGCDQAQGPQSKVGSRLYTSDFKVKRFQVNSTGEVFNTREEALESCTALGLAAASEIKPIDSFVDRAWCKNCGAALRGFFRIERFAKPIAGIGE